LCPAVYPGETGESVSKTISMKKDKRFDKVVEKLRGIKPTLNKPGDLTELIMNQLTKPQDEKKKGINISSNSGGWSIFIGFRALAALAAVFLFGFFAFQQWEIMSKVSRLEEEVAIRKTGIPKPLELKGPMTSYYKAILDKQVGIDKAALFSPKVNNEPIILDDNTLSRIIQELEQLKEENKQLRAAALNQFVDTLRKYRAKNVRIKL